MMGTTIGIQPIHTRMLLSIPSLHLVMAATRNLQQVMMWVEGIVLTVDPAHGITTNPPILNGSKSKNGNTWKEVVDLSNPLCLKSATTNPPETSHRPIPCVSYLQKDPAVAATTTGVILRSQRRECRLVTGQNTSVPQERNITTTARPKYHSGRNQKSGLTGRSNKEYIKPMNLPGTKSANTNDMQHPVGVKHRRNIPIVPAACREIPLQGHNNPVDCHRPVTRTTTGRNTILEMPVLKRIPPGTGEPTVGRAAKTLKPRTWTYLQTLIMKQAVIKWSLGLNLPNPSYSHRPKSTWQTCRN